jgi:hypothetical protein
MALKANYIDALKRVRKRKKILIRIGATVRILEWPVHPSQKPLTEAWFIEREQVEVNTAELNPDADQAEIDLERWRAVRRAKAKGLAWPKARAAASELFAAYGRPFAGSPSTMKRSHDKIQRIRKSEAAKSRTTKSS